LGAREMNPLLVPFVQNIFLLTLVTFYPLYMYLIGVAIARKYLPFLEKYMIYIILGVSLIKIIPIINNTIIILKLL